MNVDDGSQMIVAGSADDGTPGLTRERCHGVGRTGVMAVVVERQDGSCALYLPRSNESRPSLDDARAVVEMTAAPVRWRETTPGVWTARAAEDHPSRGDGWPHGRRADPAVPTKASAPGDSYTAARVLRGTARPGR